MGEGMGREMEDVVLGDRQEIGPEDQEIKRKLPQRGLGVGGGGHL